LTAALCWPCAGSDSLPPGLGYDAGSADGRAAAAVGASRSANDLAALYEAQQAQLAAQQAALLQQQRALAALQSASSGQVGQNQWRDFANASLMYSAAAPLPCSDSHPDEQKDVASRGVCRGGTDNV